eukprot:CAMPEP_0202108858 /NCGR_PEP_ID=MMETSP0965-20130614/22224_1 /ASSEMBLY_ACC=CAM_ASM_000507 /TAXON_ID=4773 /ORGANISM="Schizochytrium aggregatum, Strain ATCC28209" /LENGTH=110 /DNA_ID=CAMNT_0048678151 /DNA_START=1 /DNA_END=331 /DNA_ORIENTATION=+
MHSAGGGFLHRPRAATGLALAAPRGRPRCHLQRRQAAASSVVEAALRAAVLADRHARPFICQGDPRHEELARPGLAAPRASALTRPSSSGPRRPTAAHVHRTVRAQAPSS